MNNLKIDENVKLVLFLLLVSQLFFQDGIYLFVSTLCLYSIIYLLHKPNRPSVFIIIFLYHLMQIVAAVWLSIYLDKDINFRTLNQGLATWVSLIGLVIMFLPIIYYQNKLPIISFETLKKHAYQLSLERSFYAYLIAFIVLGAINSVRFLLVGYTQIIVSLAVLKWFFFLLFGYQCVLKKQRKKQFYFFIVLEFISGIGYFSDFKAVLFYVFILYFTFLYRITIKHVYTVAILTVCGFLAALVWTNVKTEYRVFLNKGLSSQSVQVSRNEAISKLYELSNAKAQGAINSSTAQLLDRMQATYHFSKTIDRVPSVIPFQNGSDWSDAIQFVLTPRLFNPNKPTLDVSVKTSHYTGIAYFGAKEGTQFSLGYFVDCYVDFGLFGMMVPLFGIGLLFGLMYFYFLKNSSRNYIFNYSVVGAIFVEFFALEMDNTYFIGRLFYNLLIFFALSKLFFPWLERYLKGGADVKLMEIQKVGSVQNQIVD